MPLDGFRFIHASNLNLDHPLTEIASVSEQLRLVCEDATLTAFDQILAECIERDVQFLLLTGNILDPANRSLRARLQLIEGFSLLEQHDIRVFIAPGTTNPEDAWDATLSLPDNVTAFLANDCDPVAVLKDRRVIASVRVIGSGGVELDRIEQQSDWPKHDSIAGSTTGQSRSAPYSIAVLDQRASAELVAHEQQTPSETWEQSPDGWIAHGSFAHQRSYREPFGDYLALSGNWLRLTRLTANGLAHHPGPSQGLTASETDLCSCTLIDVDSEGQAELTILPTAALRRERCHVTVAAETTQDELLDQILDELAGQRPEANERAWYVEWVIGGRGPLMVELSNASNLHDFAELVAIEVTERFDVPRQDAFRLQPLEETALLKQLAPQVLERFQAAAHQMSDASDLIQAGRALVSSGLLDHTTLESLVAELDQEEVAARARFLGTNWLSADVS